MRRKILIQGVVALFLSASLFLLPALMGTATGVGAEENPPVAEEEAALLSGSPEEPEPFDRNCHVAVTLEGEARDMELRSYLVGVVAAEAPASFEPEALKAQAAAARTYTIYKMGRGETAAHPDTPVCDDITCCKAYAGEAELRERWGTEYEANLARITAAVDGTDGMILTYEAEPILAAFHSSSAGRTAASDEVWGGTMPYLVSVESPEGEGEVPNWLSSVTLSAEEFRRIVLERFPAAQLEGEADRWVEIRSLTESGRVGTVALGGVETTGVVVRSMFGLRSAAFTVTADENGITFTTAGYGHGVGMSQYGANVLAGQGMTWDEILLFYYPGTAVTRVLMG